MALKQQNKQLAQAFFDAMTAARWAAGVRGLDLAPALLEDARKNADLAGTPAKFIERGFQGNRVRQSFLMTRAIKR
jgi:hypothetical protein